jgi:hypothetical protein
MLRLYGILNAECEDLTCHLPNFLDGLDVVNILRGVVQRRGGLLLLLQVKPG